VVSCLQRGADDLHMVQLMPLSPHHLMLQENLKWFCLSGTSLLRFLEKRPFNMCVWLCVLLKARETTHAARRIIPVFILERGVRKHAVVNNLEGGECDRSQCAEICPPKELDLTT